MMGCEVMDVLIIQFPSAVQTGAKACLDPFLFYSLKSNELLFLVSCRLNSTLEHWMRSLCCFQSSCVIPLCKLIPQYDCK